LATSHAIDLTAAVTTFQALARPNVEVDNMKIKDEIILPVIFEAVFDVGVQRQQLVVKLRAPGTVTGKFTSTPELLLTYCKVQLDTNSLVSSMVEQARLVVFKAVAGTTSFATANSSKMRSQTDSLSKFTSALHLSKYNAQQENSYKRKIDRQNGTSSSPHHISASAINLSGGGSALNLSSRGLGSRPRKTRSVTWNHPVEYASVNRNKSYGANAKRRKIIAETQSVGALKSSKSFGKPDANTFESKRNATFAEFGQTHKNLFVSPYGNAQAHGMARFQKPNVAPSSDNLSRRNAVFSAASLSLSNMNKQPSFQGGKNAIFGDWGIKQANSNGNLSTPSSSGNFVSSQMGRKTNGTGSFSDLSYLRRNNSAHEQVSQQQVQQNMTGLKPTMTTLELMLLPHKKK